MSLVEQAAKRLEELRKSTRQTDSELHRTEHAPSNPKPDTLSTIERVARRIDTDSAGPQPNGKSEVLEGPGATEGLPFPRHAALDAPAMRHQSSEGASDTDVRREPVFGPNVDVIDSDTRDDAKQSRKIAIDLQRLAAAGALTPDAVESRLANELRVIKRPIINNCLNRSATSLANANRVMLTSASPGEGKSFLSVNLAMSIAMERDSTVLLIEADTARPSLSNLLGLPSTPGLLDLLANPGMDVAQALVRTDVPKLAFLPAGTRQGNSNELLASEVMHSLVDELANRYPDRILIFDSPPLLFSPEARVLAHYMGQVVVVVEAERTTHGMLVQALSMVDDCPVVLLALNKATAPEEKGYYYYTG